MATMVATVWQDERIRVKLRVDCSKRDVFVANHVTNLSRGGLFIASEKPLPVNSELELTLALPGSPDEIRARGRVV